MKHGLPWVGMGLGWAVLLVLSALLVRSFQARRHPTQLHEGGPVQEAAEGTTRGQPGPGTGAVAGPQEPTKAPAGDTGGPAPEAWPTDLPGTERKDVGTYVASDREPPTILVQRQSQSSVWGRLAPGSRVATDDYLMSLPGYRSKVELDSGIHLTLWGNVPEFSSFPPVLESSVMLHSPPPGVDLEFTLDHGRVHLSNQKRGGPARIRCRFLREIWDLTLPRSGSEAVLELWGLSSRDAGFSQERPGPGPLACLGVFTRGEASVKVREKEYPLPGLSRLTWSNNGAAPAGPDVLAKLPDWWTDRIEPKKPEVADVMLALKDLHTALSKTDAILDGVLTQIRESDDPTNRSLGILFLGALDAVPHLVDALENRQHPEVRGTAAFALRHWIARSRDHDLEVYRVLAVQKGYSREKAEIIMGLLHGFPDAALKKPVTYARLIGYLDHENLAIRELAFWHLAHLVPEGAKKIPYDPAGEVAARAKAVQEWKKLIPEGSVPRHRS